MFKVFKVHVQKKMSGSVMSIFEVTVTCSRNVYKLQFEENDYYQFLDRSQDPEYVKLFLPDAEKDEVQITSQLTALIDSTTGEKVEFYVNNYDHDEEPTGTPPTVKIPSNTSIAASRARGALQYDTVENPGPSQTLSTPPTVKNPKIPTRKTNKVRLNTLFGGELLDDVESYLLRLIFDRPILFDYTIPINARNPNSLAREWADVHKQMKEYTKDLLGDDSVNVTVDILKETWLTIRTAYMRYKSSCTKRSGMSPSKLPEIKHLEILKNYDRVTEKRRTLSSMDDYDDEYAEQRLADATPPSKRGKVNDGFLSAAQKVLVSVSNRLDNQLPNPLSNANPSVPVSSTSLFSESLVHDLNLLNSHHLARAKMRISQVIFEELSHQNEMQ